MSGYHANLAAHVVQATDRASRRMGRMRRGPRWWQLLLVGFVAGWWLNTLTFPGSCP